MNINFDTELKEIIRAVTANLLAVAEWQLVRTKKYPIFF